MGVYIKGFKKPDTCSDCSLFYDYLYCSVDEKAPPANFIRNDCPLIGLPNIEPKRGKWVYEYVRDYPISYNLVKCSQCGWRHHSRPGEKWILTAEDVARDFYYCPYCGSLMERNE